MKEQEADAKADAAARARATEEVEAWQAGKGTPPPELQSVMAEMHDEWRTKVGQAKATAAKAHAQADQLRLRADERTAAACRADNAWWGIFTFGVLRWRATSANAEAKRLKAEAQHLSREWPQIKPDTRPIGRWAVRYADRCATEDRIRRWMESEKAQTKD